MGTLYVKLINFENGLKIPYKQHISLMVTRGQKRARNGEKNEPNLSLGAVSVC